MEWVSLAYSLAGNWESTHLGVNISLIDGQFFYGDFTTFSHAS